MFILSVNNKLGNVKVGKQNETKCLVAASNFSLLFLEVLSGKPRGCLTDTKNSFMSNLDWPFIVKFLYLITWRFVGKKIMWNTLVLIVFALKKKNSTLLRALKVIQALKSENIYDCT